MNKAYKIRLYPNKEQARTIDQTIGNCRFLFNQMLNERISVYEKLKDDKEKLYSYKYKTEKEYKQEFPFLKEGSSWALQQARQDLCNAYKKFFQGLKKGSKIGFPRFKAKHGVKWSYREPQINRFIRILNNSIILLKLGKVRFRGLSKGLTGKICSVTVIKLKTGHYQASILVEQDQAVKPRTGNGVIGLDLGLKEFAITSDGTIFSSIKDKLYSVESKIKTLQRHFSRKAKDSKRREKCRIKIAKQYQYKTNLQNHFFWHLSNKLCNENQVISIENLNVKGMVKNHKLARSISYASWGKFITCLKQKAQEYYTDIFEIPRFFPSSKTCSSCGLIKEDLSLSDREFLCDCGLEIDRDINAAINIKNVFLKEKSAEYVDNRHGESVSPKRLNFNFIGSFEEVLTGSI